jgi:hypothetical protein
VKQFIRKLGIQVSLVVYDEGLRSYKAIAFIRSNPKCLVKESISYLKLGASPATFVLAKQKTLSGFSKNLGEQLWIK